VNRSVRVSIYGRVQGVGYRAWTSSKAEQLGLKGWVRNRMDGSVEAIFSGEEAILERMLEACERGPSVARVERIIKDNCDSVENIDFRVLPTC